MGNIYQDLCGLGAGGLVYFLGKKAGRYQWMLALVLSIWICLGLSFVYIHSVGYHPQAARVSGLFFGLVALAGIFVSARTLDFIGKQRVRGRI